MVKRIMGVGAPNTNEYTTNNGVNYIKCFYIGIVFFMDV